jgi:Tol biopolymer transport system component
MRGAWLFAFLAVAIPLACASGACTTLEPQVTTYFDATIEPILQSSCVHANTGAGCHVADAKYNALGNLDLSNFAGIDHRRDVLLDYGPYQQPALLVKNVPPFQLNLELWDGTKIVVTTDIKHSAGPVLDPTASGFATLARWLQNGATVNNTGIAPVTIATTPCTHTVPSAAGFDPNVDPSGSDFALFKRVANPVLSMTCGAGNCHGTAVNALYLTCGASPEEQRWNYFAAVDYLAATPPQSEMLRRPLASSQGGSYHEGGPLFASVNDPNYKALAQWAQAHGPLQPGTLDPAFLFFAQKVQPILVKKGCMMAQCHSAAMFHDFRLRGGSAGSFSLTATRRNYAFAVAQMSFESDDVNASRLVRKNMYRPDQFSDSNGVFHRGAPLLEDFGDTHVAVAGPLCDSGNYDYQNGNLDTIPAYCVIREWHRQERAERALAALSAIVYVSRPPPTGSDRPQDFDVFAGGASLHVVPASLMATGDVTLAGADTTVDLTTCGLGSGPDVRRPAVSWDGKTIAFAARSTAGDSLAIYTMNVNGTGCAKQADIANHAATSNGLLEHDFDPAFSPPQNGVESIVFASTRGNLDSSKIAVDYVGPQRTPEDPTKPNANLYVLEPAPGASTGTMRVRQLTWQLNMERLPSFMQDGRLVFTTEKRAPGFYELALRRQNLDGGDYHPLYSQRSSIGYTQATNVVELADKNFATIFSNQSARHGAGALGVFNRSIGVDFQSTDPGAYLVDPTVIQPNSPSAPETTFFKHSLSVIATDGSYTSPSPLPDGKMLVSYGTGSPASFGGDYDLYVLDPSSGTKTKLLGSAGPAEVEAVAVYPRADKGVFTSTPDEPNGHTQVAANLAPGSPSAADVTVLDMTVLASLLFQNTPTGRLVEPDLGSFDIYEDLPPESTVTSFPASGTNTFSDAYGKVYVRRRLLGTVPLQADGSAHFRVPGGLPIVLHLPDDSESLKMKLPRWQREEMTFVPGETAHQSFPIGFFDNLCAGCHGAISGHPLDAALLPDFLTQASAVSAVTAVGSDFSGPPSGRGPIIGPPSSP